MSRRNMFIHTKSVKTSVHHNATKHQCCRGERDSDVIRGRASKQQRNSGGRPRYVANFVGNEEASESDEDCAFAFMVSETEEDICHTVICEKPVIEICVDGIST